MAIRESSACSKCSTWNNVQICSNVETDSNNVTNRHVKACKIGAIDQVGRHPRLRKMPLQALELAARPVENVSKS